MKNYFCARPMRRLLSLAVLLCVLAGLFGPTSAVKPVRAACTWGDIICEMQDAMKQLLDQYVTPLKAWVQLQSYKALYGIEYNIAHVAADFMWAISRVLTTASVGIGILNQWIAVNFFQPMIQMTSTTMKPIVGVFLFAALCVLGISYLLAAFIRLNVVSLRSVIVWWIAGGFFFSLGPSFYLSMRNLNQALSSVFQGSAVDVLKGQNPFQQLAGGDAQASNPIYAMTPLCSNFNGYLNSAKGVINGLDVSLSFQKADGYDVIGGGTKCLGGGDTLDLPRRWFDANGFFDAAKAPGSWPPMVTCPANANPCDYDGLVQVEVAKMQASVNLTFAGIMREWQSIPLGWFAVTEQLVGLCLICAQGLTFISFACAILFAFFRRTEPIAMAIVDQWLSLIVQSIVIALVQGMTLALYLAAAKSGSPLVTMAVSTAALVFMIILVVSGLKAVWSSFNKLFEAFGQASGGVFLSPGQAGGMVAGAAIAAGTGGASLAAGAVSAAGSVAGGVQALNSGATWAQAAGVTMGGSKALDGAAYHLAKLPGLRDTALGESASQYIEGASARQVGKSLLGAVPGVGGAASRLGGASLGAALLTDRNPDHAEAVVDENGKATWQQPMLQKSTEKRMSGLLSSPTWNPGTVSKTGRGGLPLHEANGTPVRKGDIPAEAADPQHGWGRGEVFTAASASQTTPTPNNPHSPNPLNSPPVSTSSNPNGVPGNPVTATNTLIPNASSSALPVQPPGVEGRLNVSGANPVAEIMGRTIDTLHGQNATTGQQGSNNEQVATAMAGVMGISPVQRDGKTVTPIEGRLNRYQMFADQALTMGLTGADSTQVLREAKANPDGHLLPDTRDRLIRQQHEERGESWADSVQHVQSLENSARMVPASITAYGTREMDVPPAETAGQPIRLSPAGSKNSTVIFTPAAPTAAAPPVFLSSIPPAQPPTASAQPIIFSPTPPASGTPPALDGMKAADKPDRPLATDATSAKSNPLQPETNQ